jgi:hypothetical protein
MIIRPEQFEDQAGIYTVNSLAFHRPERVRSRSRSRFG